MIRERMLSTLVATGLLIAACGGSTPTTAPGQTAAGGPTSGPATDGAPAATDGPAATPGGGSGTGQACDLLTTEEVEAATGRPDIEAQPVGAAETDASSACAFVSAGVLPAVIVSILDPANTNTDPSGYLSLPGSVEVAVSGARAVYAPAAGFVMLVFKGSTVATIQIAAPKDDDFQKTGEALAQKVADRL